MAPIATRCGVTFAITLYVARIIISTACGWTQFMPSSIHRPCTFWKNWPPTSTSLKASLGRHLVLIAESDLNDPRVVRPWELGGFGLDAQWSDDIHHALHTVLTGEHDGYYSDFGSVTDLATAMTRPYVLCRPLFAAPPPATRSPPDQYHRDTFCRLSAEPRSAWQPSPGRAR